MGLGRYVLGVAAIATGIVDLIWGKFELAHQPIQAWGDKLTGAGGFADAVATLLIVGGIAVMWERSERVGAALLGIGYFIFAMFWAPRIYWTIVIPGVGWRGTIGAIGGVGQQAIVVVAAVLLYAQARSELPWAFRVTPIARWVFGISVIFFGLGHLTAVEATATMVPQWMLPNADFWVLLTGLGFIAAGTGISLGILDALAGRALTLMLLIFAIVVLVPIVVHYPHSEIAWGSNAYNLAAVGAAWVLADSLANRRTLRLESHRSPSIR